MKSIYHLSLLILGLVFFGCEEDDPETSTENEAPPYTMLQVSSDEQNIIDENLALITAYYEEAYPDHFLILVGDSETLVDDMSCDSHDQEVVEQMLSGGNPMFFHLAPTEDLSESVAAMVDPEGNPLNQKYLDAPANIKDAIDYVNQFAGHEGAIDDSSIFIFNYSSDDGEIHNGKCQDLGHHQLGLFKNTIVVSTLNDADYGTSTWNGLPIYGNVVLVDVTIGGINWKLKIDEDNGKFFLRKNENTIYCKRWVYNQATIISFLECSVAYLAASYIEKYF